MGLNTINSGFRTVNVCSGWGILGMLIRVYGVDFSSATKQVLFEVDQSFTVYVQSNSIYAQSTVSKGATAGVWTSSILGKTRSEDVNSFHIVYWPLNTSAAPGFYINGELLTTTTSTTPSEVTTIASKIHFFGADRNNDSRLQGSIEEVAYFQQGLGTQPSLDQVLAMTKTTTRGYPHLLDGLEAYYGCNEVPEGIVAMGYQLLLPDSDNLVNWNVSTGTDHWAVIDDIAGGTDYIEAGDADDGLSDTCFMTDVAIGDASYITGVRKNAIVQSKSSLTFTTAFLYFPSGLASSTYNSSTMATINVYEMIFIAYPALMSPTTFNANVQTWAVAPSTISKGETGGTVFSLVCYVYFNNYRLENTCNSKFSIANQLINFGANASGNVTGTIDRLRNN